MDWSTRRARSRTAIWPGRRQSSATASWALCSPPEPLALSRRARHGEREMTLPVHAVLPDLLAALRAGPNAVLVAPPGAGKTTMVAPALLGESWCTGQVWLLSPRRLAARAAAERMAELAGEKP